VNDSCLLSNGRLVSFLWDMNFAKEEVSRDTSSAKMLEYRGPSVRWNHGKKERSGYP
jgi:hypothetical protein